MPSSNGANGGAEGVESMVEVPGIVGAGGGISAMDVVEEEGESRKDSIGEKSKEGGEDILEDNISVSGGGIDGNLVVEGEMDVLGGEIGGGGADGSNVDDSGCGGGAVGGVPSVNSSGDNGSTVEPIPLIPRWRLRDILAHAEGECI